MGELERRRRHLTGLVCSRDVMEEEALDELAGVYRLIVTVSSVEAWN